MMTEVTAFRVVGDKVVDVKGKEVKDARRKTAPRQLIEELKRAGVVSFRCGGKLDWKVVRADVQSLLRQFARGKKTGKRKVLR